jgi:hypothetical protein
MGPADLPVRSNVLGRDAVPRAGAATPPRPEIVDLARLARAEVRILREKLWTLWARSAKMNG